MNHLLEWRASCVDDQLTHLNVTALEGSCPSEYLLYSDAIPRRNDGRVSNYILQRYEHTQQGGWWCSGIDLLTGSDDLWGCFKPSQPRRSLQNQKLIKYEHPPKAPTGIFALRVPLELWQRIADRYGLTVLPEDIEQDQPDFGFWEWLMNHPELPICITEGAKKAGALLTAGYAAVALPGVNGGYRVPRDELGNRIGKSRLIPQLKKLAIQNRPIYLVFDQDAKPNTIKAVNAAIRKTGYLLNQTGCPVKVITWNLQLGKGVDDLLATHGQSVFDQAYQRATTLDTWKAKALAKLTYQSDIQLNCRYLPQLDFPAAAQLIGIKSPKGTGKTQLLESIVSQALENGQRVLVVGHRVRLVEALCQRFGLNYITEVRDDPAGAVKGYGLCFDSLHPDSQAHFNPANWSGGVVIIDEVEQVLWHGLNSSTCQSNRVAILKSLKTLIQNVLDGSGKVFLADADLSDISLDYLISLAGFPVQPLIVENEWQPELEESWQVNNYTESTPKRLVKDLERHIREGGKPFVCLSAQKKKSQWGTCTLEAYLKKQFPQLRILRLDSESLAEPTHPAYGCINNLNQVLGKYDIVLASPAIETGVSIEVQGHFTSVWGIAQGIQAENSVRQALGRVRENLPRFIWVASYGFNQVGNGSTSIPSLLSSGHRLTQLNIRLLQQTDFHALDDLDMGFQAESLLCWAKMAVRFNASMVNYRESVVAALVAEGHQVVDVPPEAASKKGKNQQGLVSQGENNSLMTAITAVRNQNYQAECEAVASAEELSARQYQNLNRRMVKTLAERRSQRKYDLKVRYGVPVTANLVAKDDDGWYHKLQVHYFLTLGRQYLAERDAAIARRLLDLGQGSIFLPDFNRNQLGAVIGTMELLGIPVLLADRDRELRNTDEDLRSVAALALANRSAIRTAVGIGLAKNSTPIVIIRRFLDKIGYGLRCIRSESREKKRLRVYRVLNPDDGRVEVFKYWLAFGGKLPATGDVWQNEFSGQVDTKSENSAQANYVQLALSFE
ncbi:plasmid replication protein, CyRepA1 family [Lyngbya aestuarii]|uniref:plasmid replication protein, CyRepA1 family n=1 Tax=Lyngbya aestuarii TaxID=118322 RepID=UPI00403D7045